MKITSAALSSHEVGRCHMRLPYTRHTPYPTLAVSVSYYQDHTYVWRPSTDMVFYRVSGHVPMETLINQKGWADATLARRMVALSRVNSLSLEGQYTRSLYALEDTFDRRSIPRDNAAILIRTIAKKYGVKIGVKFDRLPPNTLARMDMKRVGVLGDPYENTITLRDRRDFRLHTILHEIAHVLDYRANRHIGHGPSFIAAYLDLLALYRDYDAYSANVFQEHGLTRLLIE